MRPIRTENEVIVLLYYLRDFDIYICIYTSAATSGAGTAYPSGESEFTPGF